MVVVKNETTAQEVDSIIHNHNNTLFLKDFSKDTESMNFQRHARRKNRSELLWNKDYAEIRIW